MSKRALIIGVIVLLLGGLGWWFFQSDNTYVPVEDAILLADLPENTLTVIAFGDSLTAGYGVSHAEAYPAQLETMLVQSGYHVSVINAGVSGETTRGNLERAHFIRLQNPDIVIIGIGGNDALRALPIEETRKNILATIDILQSGEAPPRLLLLAMQAPLNAGFSYKKEFDSLYETIASERGLMLVPFITEDVFLDVANKLPDGIHYNKRGYQKVVDHYLFPRLVELLNEMEDRSR